MRRRARALALAAGHFLLWLGVLYAGADHPPPPGFLWLVALDLVASLGVYLRAPAYAAWQEARRPRRIVAAVGEGAAVGLAFAAVTLLLAACRPGSEVVLDWTAVLIWHAVLALVGAANAGVVYGGAALALGRRVRT